jgi:antitoxin (DNA-binding transcriptional repressor) of toxin-antitoxin stability system
MESSYGIESARAKLGEIADHARLTGQTIGLTRHGRTVAVIGPAHAVQPAGTVKVSLYVGDKDPESHVLPAVPRIGDTFRMPDENFYLVTGVQWNVEPDGENDVDVLLDPVEEYSDWNKANKPAPNRK